AAVAVCAAPAPPPTGYASRAEVVPAARKLHQELEKVMDTAAERGAYTCCISPPCAFCASRMAMCPCGKSLARRGPVCRECKGGWEVGEGRMSGIKPDQVVGIAGAG